MTASRAEGQPPLPIDGGTWDGPTVIQDATLAQHMEISSAVVLPNEAGHVLFWAQVDCATPSTIDTPSAWLWRSVSPTQAAHKPAPGSGLSTRKPSLKGTGMAHLPNGDVLAAGATEQHASCMGTLSGSEYAWIWDSQTANWAPNILTMNVAHYYPTVVIDQTGTPVVLGHDNDPLPAPDNGHNTFQRYTGVGASPWTTDANYFLQSNCAQTTRLTVNQYPRAHLLATTGSIFHTNVLAAGNKRGTAFLEVQPQSCAFPGWKTKDAPPPVGTEENTRQWTCTVHYVWYDSGIVHDTVYMIGGTDRDACQAEVVYANVDRLQDPTPATWWSPTTCPLNQARKKHNAVILMDGSILVVGGLDPNCAPLLDPERLEPVEAFGTAPAQWGQMAAHELEREEHSVAVLLPSGEVWLAGGDNFTHSYHSVEVFRPPYLHHGRIPAILSVGFTNWSYGVSDVINVRCYDDSEPERVALIKLGSVTHGVDMGQRYVEVQENLTKVQLPNGSWNLFVNTPSADEIAPAGPYWLTVRDSNGRPSAGTLIMVG